MEPSSVIISIDKDIKFKKADLEAIRDSENGVLSSSEYRVCDISNVKYYLKIYPNRSKEHRNGQACIYLSIKRGNAIKVEVNIDCAIGSADFKVNVNQVHASSRRRGFKLCTTEELFDESKKFFIIDEMTVKITGTLKIYFSQNKIIYPLSIQWKIKQTDLEPFKVSTDDEMNIYASENFNISSTSNVKYYLELGPNFENSGKAWLFFHLQHGPATEKREAILTFSIDSVNYSVNFHNIYDDAFGWGKEICTAEDLFNSEKQYFVDGEMIIKINGTLSMEKQKNEFAVMENENEAAIMNLLIGDDGKDFTIMIGDRNIKVHKQLLLDSSPYFIGMFNSGMIESTEMKTTITDFDYEIVEAGIHILYYPWKLPTHFTFEQMLELLRFSDKYDIEIIKSLVRNHFVDNLSPTNVCPLLNFTTTAASAPKLHSKCCEFIFKCSEEKKAVHGLDTVDKDLLLKILMGNFVRNI